MSNRLPQNVFDEVPPHDEDAERAVLGAMFDPRAHKVAVSELTPDHFYIEKHRYLFAASRAAGEIPQGARQTTGAKQIDNKPKDVLLSLFEEPARDALECVVADLTALRQEEVLEPRVCGLDEYSGPDTESRIEDAQEFLSIQGLPPTARKVAMKELVYAYLPNLSTSDRAAIEAEIAATPTPTENSLTAISKHFENITGAQI